MMRMHVVVFAGIVSAQVLNAQVITSAVPFLLIAPNSRASGMGEAGVALADDGWATFWNPAGYAFQQGSEVSLSHANWLPQFNLSDLWITHFVYKQEVQDLDGTVSAAITYLNLGEFNRTDVDPTVLETFKGYEFAVAAGYGTKLSSDLGIGLNARFIYSHLAPFGAGVEEGRGVSSGFSFDVGFLYKPSSLVIPFTDYDLGHRINFGLNISNIGPHIAYIDKAQADPLPMNFKIGFALKLMESEFNNFTILGDFSKLLITRDSTGKTDQFYKAFFTSWYARPFNETLRQFVTGFGAEYWYGSPKLVALRTGYFYEDPRAGGRKFMTFGGGIRYDIYTFDFSYISAFEDQHPLGETLRFTLGITWETIKP
ncbi:MAG: type IX secretion system outer membrane channel protein PorV [Bacteroidota bacterium]